MKLYHGTNETLAKKILVEGLRPRGKNGNSNWTHSIESNPNAVYLTDAYAMHFCFQSTDPDNPERWAIFEVDTDLLKPYLLRPDEDVLEQAGRKHDNLPVHWDMKRRTRHYRKLAEMDPRYIGKWTTSLEAMGTCAYYGNIPTSAITQVSYFDPEKNPAMAMHCAQATICLANYHICGAQYKAMLRWMTGKPVMPEEVDNWLAMAPEKLDAEMSQWREARYGFLNAMLAERDALEIVTLTPEEVR